MPSIQISDFPRTQWRESVGMRKALTAGFNVARKDTNKLLALQAHLRFMTQQVNRALLELETGKQLAVAPAAAAEVQPVQLAEPVMTAVAEPVQLAPVQAAPVLVDPVQPMVLVVPELQQL